MPKAVVSAIVMGYGHLRPAAALADYFGTDVLQMDHPPLGDERDRKFWESTRDLYEPLTRLSQLRRWHWGPYQRAPHALSERSTSATLTMSMSL